MIKLITRWWNKVRPRRRNENPFIQTRVCVTTWRGCQAHIPCDRWGRIDGWRDDVTVAGGCADMIDVTYDDGDFDVIPVSQGSLEWKNDHWRLHQ